MSVIKGNYINEKIIKKNRFLIWTCWLDDLSKYPADLFFKKAHF